MPSCASSHPTETRLNEIWNLSLISFATISRVHKAKAKLSCNGFFCVTTKIFEKFVTIKKATRTDLSFHWVWLDVLPLDEMVLAQGLDFCLQSSRRQRNSWLVCIPATAANPAPKTGGLIYAASLVSFGT